MKKKEAGNGPSLKTTSQAPFLLNYFWAAADWKSLTATVEFSSEP